MNKEIEKTSIDTQLLSNKLYNGIVQIIDNARNRTAVFLNSETTLMYWNIGRYINTNLKENNKTAYGKNIVATLSQQLSWSHRITK